jgi:hypothetical protein
VLTYNLSGGITLTINNLRLGIPFNLMVTNGYTAAAQFKIAATTPSGASYSVVWKAAGSAAAFTNMTSGPSPAASTSYSFTGSTNTGPILNLIYA